MAGPPAQGGAEAVRGGRLSVSDRPTEHDAFWSLALAVLQDRARVTDLEVRRSDVARGHHVGVFDLYRVPEDHIDLRAISYDLTVVPAGRAMAEIAALLAPKATAPPPPPPPPVIILTVEVPVPPVPKPDPEDGTAVRFSLIELDP